MAFNVILVALGFTLPQGPDNWPSKYLTAYIMSGGLGIVATLFFSLWYTSRAKEIIRVAETTIKLAGEGTLRT